MDFVISLEDKIKRYTNNFVGFEDLQLEIKGIVDIIFSNSKNDLTYRNILDYFDINGNIILYGKPGVGKTSLAFQIADYVLNSYRIKPYKVDIARIIRSNLGEATNNMKEAIEYIKNQSKKYGMFLIIDEIDRLFVNRANNNELSELKRMLIEFMDFIDNLKLSDRTVIIGITNLIDLLDDAFLRRFLFIYKVSNNEHLIVEYILKSNELLDIEMDKKDIEAYSKKMAKCSIPLNSIKNAYRAIIIKYNKNNNKNELKKQLINNFNLLLNKDKNYVKKTRDSKNKK